MKKARALRKIKKLLEQRKWMIVIAIVVGVGGIIWAYDHAMTVQRLALQAAAEETKTTEKQLADSKTAKPTTTDNPLLSTSTSPTPAVSSTPSTSTKPKPSGAQTYMPAPTPQIPNNSVFRITGASMNGSWSCGYYGAITVSGHAFLYANNTNGGTFTWVVDVTGSNGTSSPTSTPVPNTFPAGATWYQPDLVNPGSGPQFLDSNARPGESFRFRILSPNSVALSWYTVPPDATCPH